MFSRLSRYLIRICLAIPDLAHAPARKIRRRKIEQARYERKMLVSFMPALGAKMIIDPTTYFSDVFVKGFYEIDLVNYFKKSLRPGMTCIDIGANIGYFTMLMAKRVGPRGSVISFEPTQNSLDLLRRNIQLNGFDNVVAENLALSDYNGAARFHEGPPGYEVYNSIGRITHPSAKDQSFTARSVSCVTLDDYLAARNIEKVDVIKIDVEGAELSVLRGMEKTLQTNPNARLIVEFAEQTTRGFGYSAKEIGDWLTKRGWRLALFNSRGRISEVTGDETWMGQMVLAYKAN